ncbi:hypothetical protein EJ04DRAFT_390081, partial [Polyplosphaeria fusca]
MVQYWPSLNENHVEFIKAQPLFFVASAPLAGRHCNLSPKGHPNRSLAILDATTVAYLDATGSGCETISHIYENGRVTVMFCSFGTSPKIMRLFCTGKVVERDDDRFETLRRSMGPQIELMGQRAIILLHVFKVQTSCGFAVPLIGQQDGEHSEHTEEKDLETQQFVNRDTLDNWATKMMEKDALLGFQKNLNFQSLDGLPGMRSARRARGQWMAFENLKARMRRVGHQWDAVLVGV